MATLETRCMPLIGLVPGALPAEVLAIVSHDLRSSLGAITMSTSLLGEEAQSEASRAQVIKIIRRATAQMDRLIRDILEVTRLEAGQGLVLRRTHLQLGRMLEDACELLAGIAGRRGQTLEYVEDADVPDVHADPDRLWQVVSNLVENASKFTPRGGRITLSVRALEREARVSVADSGPGIAAADLPRVFDPFWQATRTASLGAGLGLAIARGIVESHGGRIWVDSAPGAGTTFSFALPAAAGAAA